MKKHLYMLVGLLLVLSSCASKKQLTYFGSGTETAEVKKQESVYIQPGDELTIAVYSLEQAASAPYNLPSVYVNEVGEIALPGIDAVNVLNKTAQQAAALIREGLQTQVKKPIVYVTVRNAYLTVLGEVNKPGQIRVNGPINILEVLGLAGDLTNNGRRDNVLVIRNENNTMRQIRVNLNDNNLFTSEAFTMHRGDVLYVSPRFGKTSK